MLCPAPHGEWEAEQIHAHLVCLTSRGLSALFSPPSWELVAPLPFPSG